MSDPDAHIPGIGRDSAISMLHTMRRVRQLSLRIAKLYPSDVMETPVHLCIGQEAVSAGLCAHLDDGDQLLLGHRTHGPALAKGMPIEKLVAELYGRTTGCSGARGGSMHVFDAEHGLPGSSAIVGGSIALGVGAGLSAKLQGAGFIGVSYFGDAATNAGVFYESMNFAALKKLPVLFVCENNGLSNVMPIEAHSSHNIVTVAQALMPTIDTDGTDALAVYRDAGRAVQQVRTEQRPVFLHAKTKRWMRHQGHEFDNLSINDVDQERDCPIGKLEKFLFDARLVSRNELSALERQVEDEIDAAIRFAEASPYPVPDPSWIAGGPDFLQEV